MNDLDWKHSSNPAMYTPTYGRQYSGADYNYRPPLYEGTCAKVGIPTVKKEKINKKLLLLL